MNKDASVVLDGARTPVGGLRGIFKDFPDSSCRRRRQGGAAAPVPRRAASKGW